MAKQEFCLGTLRLMRDATLGTGAYGQVCKAMLDELPCAAKLLHPILVDPNNPRNLTKFEQECRFLSEIRHPNIVQYLGVARDGETGLPVLLMELMDDSLTHFLEQSEEPLAYHVQVNISHDIALAVAFLHSKHIIHRDLSSNNVLLGGDGKRAKVTDFGMSKIDSHMTRLTKCPGTAAYMAPEALLDPPVYTEKLDCFQIGVLMIQIITRKFPDPGPAMNRVRDARYPTGWTNAPVPEVERRQTHLSIISQTNLMLIVVRCCLKDRDSERPSAQQICEELSALKEISQYGQGLLKEREQLIEQLRQENQEKEVEIREKEREVVEKEMKIGEKERIIKEKEREVVEKETKIGEKERIIRKKEREAVEKETKIGEQERMIREKEREVREKEKEIGSLQSQLKQKDGEMERTMRIVGRMLHGQYYDILLLGKTGMGKSTTANKILRIDEATNQHPGVSRTETIMPWGKVKGEGNYFEARDGLESITNECKLLTNEYIRVLDTPGLAHTVWVREIGIMKTNQHILRSILRERKQHNLAFHRLLYFLPTRGPPERAVGTLQEEIKVMYEYLGQDIFNIMVIIATHKKGKRYQYEYDEEDIAQTKRGFTKAFERVTDQCLPECPPVLYLSFDETDVLSKIVAAEVISELSHN